MEVFMGMIIPAGFNFAPQGWSTCSGQMLSISQFSALYSLLGTTFGGNGSQTFALPNLNGRRMVGTGQSAGTANYVLGQAGGNENVTLTQAQMPVHTHAATFSGAGSSMSASSSIQGATSGPVATGTLGRAVDNAPNPTSKPAIYTPAGSAADTALGGLNVAGTVTVAAAGGNSSVSVLDPYLPLTMIIAVQGLYPTRP